MSDEMPSASAYTGKQAQALRRLGAINTGLTQSNPKLLENLQAQREALVERLNKVDAAIAALEANPEIEKTLNLLFAVGGF